MSKIFIKPNSLLNLITKDNAKNLKLFFSGMGQGGKDTFSQKSIPTANLIDLADFCEPKAPIVYTTPSVAHFNSKMRQLNVKEGDKVVIYNGVSAAKVWHIFKYHGHQDVWILDGGLKEWARLDFPLDSFKQPIDYSNTEESGKFKSAGPHGEMIIQVDELLEKIGTETQIIDSRAAEQYSSGQHNEKGHIPGSKNLHFGSFFDNYGNLKPKEDLLKIVESLNLDPTKETITYCQGGVTACIAKAVLKEIGFEKVRLYDGSWSEFSSLEKTKNI